MGLLLQPASQYDLPLYLCVNIITGTNKGK